MSFDHEWLEIHLGVLKCVWGIWYLLPFDIYNHVPSTKNLGDLFPEWVWGAFFLALGASQLFAVANRRKMLHVRATFALFSIGLWSVISVMAFYGNPRAPAAITTVVFAASNLVIYLRIRALENSEQINGLA